VVEGSCEVPVGAFARVRGDQLELEAFLGMPDGTRIVRKRTSGACEDAEKLGQRLGESLLASGGRDILRDLAALKA
jgi:hydroxymethylbilane synthase